MDELITNEIIESFLQCQYKSFLKRCGENGKIHSIEALYKQNKESLLSAYAERIREKEKTLVTSRTPITRKLFSQQFDLILQAQIIHNKAHLYIDFLEKVSTHSGKNSFGYIPIWLSPLEHVTKIDRLFVTCCGLLLQNVHKIESEYGKILYGNQLQSVIVKYEKLAEQAQDILEHIRANPSVELFLNKHCPACEFSALCREKARELDHLSLLGGIKPKEIQRFNSKGIFTINQLSYTFRPRRNRKLRNVHTKPHSFELQALAIREQKVHVYEIPTLPTSPVAVYLDIEGIPDENFQYLLGVVVHDQNTVHKYSFWANTKDEEKAIFQQLLTLLSQYSEYTLFHYGSYETKALKRMKQVLPDTMKDAVEEVLQSCCNILSFLYSNIYMPTYTNRLKDVASFLGFTWSMENASGLQSIVWRKQWEKIHREEVKTQLIQYNLEDCYALIAVKDYIYSIIQKKDVTEKSTFPETVYPDEFNRLSFSFQDKNFVFSEMKFIRDCSYFDYQKEKVHARKHPRSPKKNPPKARKNAGKLSIDESVHIPGTVCSACQNKNIQKTAIRLSKDIVDLQFFDFGVKRWVTKYTTLRYHCDTCNQTFTPERYLALRKNFGHKLKCWTIYQHIVNRESFAQIQFNLNECYGISLSATAIHEFKEYFSEYYCTTYTSLLQKILASQVMYVDETPFNMQYETAYAWVFTNSQEVISMYKPNREGAFLKDLLKDFTGVLVSDFFQAYDSLSCPQQKCLIHLVRDFNSDLIKNPFDEEFKTTAHRFTILLQRIVQTVDKYGLRTRYLKKHQGAVDVFFHRILSPKYTSEIAQKYQQRFEKNRNTLFTFLEHDNVSWNNTYAEHAIKLLAIHRNKNIRFFRESRLDDYLKIMSLYQTCRYKEVSFLKFLLSQETDLDKYCKKFHLKKGKEYDK